jgi:glycerate 2-kinase
VRVVVAPDKFKGSLTAVEVAAHVAIGLHSVVADLDVIQCPVADGGDGTVDAAVAAGYTRVPVTASGPTGQPVSSSFARKGAEAVIELASVCGLAVLPGGRFEPETSSSYGLGEVVRAAVASGVRRIVLGIGGSASTDGGAGMVQALGIRVLDAAGNDVARGGAALSTAAAVDFSALPAGFTDVELVVASDVDNPLTGANGAAAVYGPQKGASGAQVAGLDAALTHWAHVLGRATGTDLAAHPGAGAAGGVGFAAMAALGATRRPGIDVVLDLVGLHETLLGAGLVVTGEGSLDAQSLAGKTPVGVAQAARRAGVRTVAVCGRRSLDVGELHRAGIAAAYALTDIERDIARCMSEAGPLLERIGAIVARAELSATSA